MANSTSAAFDFYTSEPGATFGCSLDGEPFAGCGALAEYAGRTEDDPQEITAWSFTVKR